jgi:hypothetical protein
VIRRRVERADLIPGLTAMAVRSGGRITVSVSEATPARLQRAAARRALRAARRAEWTRNPVPPVLLLFTGAALWRAARSHRFAVAGSAVAAAFLAVAFGVTLTRPAASPPPRATVTTVTPGSAAHTGGVTRQSTTRRRGHAQTPEPGHTGVVVTGRQTTPARAAGTTLARTRPGPTAVTSTPPAPSPDPSPTPSPNKTRHCILFICF